jgi:hypothetical protein
MILIVHITIALLGIIAASLSLLQPSRSKLRATYALVAATIVSGVYLVAAHNTPLVHACLSGVSYVGLTTGVTYLAQKKLKQANQKI